MTTCSKNGCYQLRAMLPLPRRKGWTALLHMRKIMGRGGGDLVWRCHGLNLMKVGVLLKQFKYTAMPKYHKVYRTYCSNSRLNSFTDKNDSADPNLTKKNTFSSRLSDLQKYPCCILCDGQDRHNLLKIVTDHVDTNIKAWAKRTNNFQLLGKLISQAANAHAGGTYYL